ncbi:MAG TPA: DEDD exonuclease domain-containing protein [Ruania sp.]|nr:DEDD exonuclease domain-containing protein [Ruania sp.]
MRAGLFTAARPGGRIDRPDAGAGAMGQPVQLGLEDIGTPLFDATFVVVDLETTGGSARESAITEIGAVKVRGGETIGEFQTLVNPGVGIPPTITLLTGITNAMVMTAPRISAVLPSFLEFLGDAVLVAHNARFDVGFLKSAAARLDLTWPRPPVVDTLALARRVVTRDEAPNHKLGTLAALFRTEVAPDHRALTDARATVDVLHGLFARMSSLGLTHVEDLATAADPVPPARRRKATLADDLPTSPGVYLFLGPRQEVLYVGTATNLRRRVRSYFTAAEKRKRIGEMVDLATAVRPIPCATPLEAAVRELRAIAEHDPRYNRRSRTPQRRPWVRLTAEAYPRLSVARTAPPLDGGACLGPFPSRASASLAVEAIVAATGLRTCTATLPRVPATGASACILLELGRCAAPCVHPGTDYATRVSGAQRVLGGDAGAVVDTLRGILARLTAQERFEEAAVRRDQLLAYLRTAARAERLGPLRRARQILAARRREGGGWEILLLRYGRFAGTVLTPPGRSPMPAVEALRATGEQVADPTTVAGPASDEETALLADWLERPGTRLIECDLDAADGPGWSVPVHGAQRHLEQLGA